MDQWWPVREGFYDWFSILSIKNKKIFNWWIDNINENESECIDWYHQYRSIEPSPIVSSYARHPVAHRHRQWVAPKMVFGDILYSGGPQRKKNKDFRSKKQYLKTMFMFKIDSPWPQIISLCWAKVGRYKDVCAFLRVLDLYGPAWTYSQRFSMQFGPCPEGLQES